MNVAELLALCDRQAAEAEFAARQWLALREALGLDAQATAQGVVTEIEQLRARVMRCERHATLDDEPLTYDVRG